MPRPAAASLTAPSWLRSRAEPTVLAALPRAVYLHAGSWADVLCVLDADALRLPNSVLVPSIGIGRGEPLAAGLAAGDRVAVEDGRIFLPSTTLECRRSWRPAAIAAGSVPELDSHLARVLTRRLRPGATGLSAAAEEVVDAAVQGDADSLRQQLGWLIGCGPGLTPSGDDVLCGVLLGLRAAGQPRAASMLGQAVRESLTATTSLSASLLAAAADGWCLPQVRDALAGLRSVSGVDQSLALLGTIGHSSGHDLAVGLLAALTPDHSAITSRQPAGTDQLSTVHSSSREDSSCPI